MESNLSWLYTPFIDILPPSPTMTIPDQMLTLPINSRRAASKALSITNSVKRSNSSTASSSVGNSTTAPHRLSKVPTTAKWRARKIGIASGEDTSICSKSIVAQAGNPLKHSEEIFLALIYHIVSRQLNFPSTGLINPVDDDILAHLALVASAVRLLIHDYRDGVPLNKHIPAILQENVVKPLTTLREKALEDINAEIEI